MKPRAVQVNIPDSLAMTIPTVDPSRGVAVVPHSWSRGACHAAGRRPRRRSDDCRRRDHRGRLSATASCRSCRWAPNPSALRCPVRLRRGRRSSGIPRSGLLEFGIAGCLPRIRSCARRRADTRRSSGRARRYAFHWPLEPFAVTFASTVELQGCKHQNRCCASSLETTPNLSEHLPENPPEACHVIMLPRIAEFRQRNGIRPSSRAKRGG